MASAIETRSLGGDGTWTRMHSIITVDEMAHGLRVNRKTVYEMIQRGEIPGVQRIGGRYRACRDTVLEWVRSGARVLRSSRSER